MEFLRTLLITAIAVLLLALVLAGWGYYYFEAPEEFTEPRTVIIERGAGFRGAIRALSDHNVIRHPWAFGAIIIASDKVRTLKAGEYLFPAGSSPRQILDMLVAGRVVAHNITIPEGLTVMQVNLLLERESILSGVADMAIPEGSLLPETYQFLYGDKRQDVMRHMQFAQKVVLTESWNKRQAGLPFASPEQAVILASIVEKETAVPEERGKIAAVFINRLKRGMPLQSDPTVIYALEKDKGPLGRALLTADLAVESPYNTYRVVGLPPTAICNPGRASIEAVLNPPTTGDYYFVADGKGGHHFSSSLEQHNGYVREYRRLQRQQKQSNP